jgi:hypothetical protein
MIVIHPSVAKDRGTLHTTMGEPEVTVHFFDVVGKIRHIVGVCGEMKVVLECFLNPGNHTDGGLCAIVVCLESSHWQVNVFGTSSLWKPVQNPEHHCK